MLHLDFIPFPTLTTDRLQLRELNINDAPAIFFLRSNAEILKYLDRHPEKSIEETKAFIQKVEENKNNAEGILWAITLKENDAVIGTICYWRLEKQHYRAEIGYLLHPSYQGKGIMDEALKAVLQYGFDVMNLHSVEANVNPLNEASIRLLEKNGFVKEAHFKENYFFDGRFLDSAIYSLLAPKK